MCVRVQLDICILSSSLRKIRLASNISERNYCVSWAGGLGGGPYLNCAIAVFAWHTLYVLSASEQRFYEWSCLTVTLLPDYGENVY
jgi:hypothetical protein